MAEVADLYYLRDFTQQQIAERFRISRPTVSRLLRASRAAGIVRIQVVPPESARPDLERELEEAFGLRGAVVTAGRPDSPRATLQALGRAGAEYLGQMLKGGERIGVSWGTTLRAVVEHLRFRPLRPSVVPLVGGLGQSPPGIHANDLAQLIAAALSGTVHLLHAPAVLTSRSVRRALQSDDDIQRVLKRARQVEVALVGIGALIPSSTIVRSRYFSAEDIAALRARGAVGDICTRVFTRDGRVADPVLDARILALEMDEIRRIPTVIGVAGGVEKAEAIAGALRGRLVDVLITDQDAARAVLRLVKGAEVVGR